MKLLSLDTVNFKRLGTGTSAFTDGLNVVSGENGKGKTTLLRAVATALYGTAAVPGLASDISTRGCGPWKVTLTFSLPQGEYTVSRTASSASLHKGADLAASGHTAVTAEVESLTGMTFKDFCLFVYSRQGETQHALTYGATALQRKVEEFSGADIIEKVSAEVKERSKRAAWEVDATQSGLLTPEEENALKGEVQAASEEVAKADKALKALQWPDGPTKPSVDVAALRAASKEWTAYRTAFAQEQALREVLAQELAAIELPEDPTATLDEAEARVATLETKKEQAERSQRNLERLQDRLVQIASDKVAVEWVNDEDAGILAAEYTEAKAGAESAQAAVSDLEAKCRHLKSHVEKGKCPSCGTVLAGDLEAKKSELAECTAELKSLRDSAEQATSVEYKTRERKREFEGACRTLAELSDREADLQRQVSELACGSWEEEDTVALTQARASVQQSKVAYDVYKTTVSRKEVLKARLSTIGMPEVPACEKVSDPELAEAEEAHLDYTQAHTAYLKACAEVKEHQFSLRERKTKSEGELSRLEAKRSGAAAMEAKHREALGKKDKLTRLDKFLRQRRESYLNQVWSSVTALASTLVGEFSGNALTGVSLVDGKFLFEEEGAWVPVAEASGAQSAFIGAAVRIALSKALQAGGGLMLFDEPTEAMTEGNARQFVATLAACCPQVALITHRETDQGLADNVIEV